MKQQKFIQNYTPGFITGVMLILLLQTSSIYAQGIKGRVLDEKKEQVVNAAVSVYQDGVQKGFTVTDYDGYYTVKPIVGGLYDVLIFYPGYDSSLQKQVLVNDSMVVISVFLSKKPSKPIPDPYIPHGPYPIGSKIY